MLMPWSQSTGCWEGHLNLNLGVTVNPVHTASCGKLAQPAFLHPLSLPCSALLILVMVRDVLHLPGAQGGASGFLVKAMMDCEVLSTVWTKP